MNAKPIWANVTEDYQREEGEQRWLRQIDPDCWISVLYRKTGFGWCEWETAIMFQKSLDAAKPSWKDRELLIICGDRRNQLALMPKEGLREWYAANIEGNRNTMDTLLHALKERLKHDA